jgi:hypothetical protein
MASIFLSGTIADLQKERESLLLICQKLAIGVICQEHFGAWSNNSIDVINSKIRKADCMLYILLQGYRYGSLIPPKTMVLLPSELNYPKNKRVSYSQFEYDIAKYLRIPQFVYIKKTRKQPAYDISKSHSVLLKEFLGKIKKDNRTFYEFTNLLDFSIQATIDIKNHIQELEYKELKSGPVFDN